MPTHKDSSESRTGTPVTRLPGLEGVFGTPPRGPARGWHFCAKYWYKSLAESSQSQFFERSDWELAYYCAEIMSRNLLAESFSSATAGIVDRMMSNLLTSVADRRRMHYEVEKARVDVDLAKAAIAATYKNAAV